MLPYISPLTVPVGVRKRGPSPFSALEQGRLSHVEYVGLSNAPWPQPGYETGHVDEVDMGVVLHFVGRGSTVITWATPGLGEGLALTGSKQFSELPTTDVSDVPAWRAVVGTELTSVKGRTGLSNHHGVSTVTMLQFDFGPRDVQICLGEYEAGLPVYAPTNLLVTSDHSALAGYVATISSADVRF